MEYIDVHLSHVAPMAWEGFPGRLNVALVEVTGVTEDGELVPSSSVGNNKTWIDLADRVILEVNARQPRELDGMHDIYYGTALPPHRRPVMINRPDDRIGIPHFTCPPGEDRRHRRDRRSGPQHRLQADRRRLPGDRQPPHRLPRPRGAGRADAA